MQILDNSTRAKNTINLFYVSIGISILAVFADVLDYQNLEGYYTDEFSMTDLFISLVGLGQIAISITLIVVFLNWFRRAYANLHRLGIGYLNHTDLHAVWCWFVPILNLFRPYKITKEIWSETQHQINKLNNTFQVDPSDAGIGVWWGFYLISNFIANIGTRLSFRADSIEELEAATILIGISNVLDIAAAFLAIAVVKKISNVEALLAHELEATSFGQTDVDINTEEQDDEKGLLES
jgi:hypothetical protein